MGKRKQGRVPTMDRQDGFTTSKALQAEVESAKGQEKEEKTHNDNKKREVDVGFDISTSVVGVCVLDSKTGAKLYLSHQKLAKFEDEYEKADNFTRDWFEPTWKVRKIFIEEAAKKFSPGFSSADTIMTLGRFNGILSYMVYGWFGVKPKMVNVRSARARLSIKIDYKDKSKDTKTKVLEHVVAANPGFPWITHLAKSGKSKGLMVYDKVNEDMADAWVICAGGRLIHNTTSAS